ncbi:ExbD/TolR family protein [Hymenobacter mellowenesis]|uniref:ExbD/TolR family protein n=1 Tax=Hymenobacter mellowenesis TaxID=3063995 RepID=UPI00272A4D3E|nr:hypothetical protein [Hymenobacter sp. M29]
MLLLVSFMFLPTGRFESPSHGVVKDAQLPFNNAVCWRDGTGSNPVISIDHTNNFSFGIQEFEPGKPTAGAIRAAVTQRVCANHGIQLNNQQKAQANKLAWLSVNAEALPALLCLGSQQQPEPTQSRKLNLLSDKQLQEYVAAAKIETDLILKRHMSVYIRIDANAGAGRVMHLIDILQDIGINRFELMAQGR